MNRVRVQVFAIAASAVSVVAWGVALVAGQQVPTAPVFTIQQATAGRSAYAKHCASCHMPDLSGNNEMPPLAGTAFKETWGTRSTKDLFDYMSAAMPYGGPSLSADTYTSIAAYVLQFNGAVAGERELSGSTAVPIGSLTAARVRSK
jgi:mono/diheme cytochrome c family protein